jgi:pilus assembly protein CpaE
VTQDGTAASSSPGNGRFEVVVVDAEQRNRMRMGMQLASYGNPPSFPNVEALIRSMDQEDPEGDPNAPIRATVVVFGPEMANAHGFEQIQRVTHHRPDLAAVIVVEEMTTTLLQQAMRAGVGEAVALDGGEHALRQAVEYVGNKAAGLVTRVGNPEAGQHRGRLILSFSTKGGVGKSMVATNLAVALARRNPPRGVSLIDCDLQFGDVGVLLGVPPTQTVVDAAAAITFPDPETVKMFLGLHEASGLRVLPAPVEPSAADQVRPEEMVAIVESMLRLSDYVVADMPPHFDDSVLALLEIADDILLVASMDIPSIKNVKIGIQTLDLMSLAGGKIHLVLNRANAKVRLDVKEVERSLGMEAEFPIPSDIAVPQSVNRGVAVVLDSPKSPAARAIEKMTDVLIANNTALAAAEIKSREG